MCNLKVNSNMEVVDLDSKSGRILGKINLTEQGYAFEKGKQRVGYVNLPIRLTVEEEESLCWILSEYY